MSKRNATGPSRSRKKRKGAGYASVDLDLPDEDPGNVEIVRVWDVGTSKTTGRVSATRKTHRHINSGMSKHAHEEPTLVVEDVDVPADPEPSKQLPVEPVAKRKGEKVVKENDSVSYISSSSSHLIFIRRQTKMTDWLRYRSIMLDELLRADGLGDSTAPGICVKCMKLAGEYRCSDCFVDGMCCSGCIVSSHHHLPLHRVQVRYRYSHSDRVTEILILGLGGWVFQARNP